MTSHDSQDLWRTVRRAAASLAGLALLAIAWVCGAIWHASSIVNRRVGDWSAIRRPAFRGRRASPTPAAEHP